MKTGQAKVRLKTARNIVLGSMAGVVLVGFLLAATYVFWVTRDLPSYDMLAHYEPPVTTRLYAGNGTLIGEYARERRLFVPIGQMPDQVKEAFLSAEDKNFYSHPGVDVFGIARAAVNDLRNTDKRPQGASTITQQVARNFLLSSELKFSRKIREMVLAMRIDNAFSKDQILELYLNEIFLGDNSYGVAAAATNYFGKSLDELSLAQVAFIAGLPKAPSNYHPVRRKQAAIARRNYVLGQMWENGYITREQMDAADAEDLVTYNRPFGAVAADVDYFVEEVRRTLYEKYGDKALYDGGLQVRSTLVPRLQDIAVRSLRAGLIAYDRRHGFRAPLKHVDLKGDWQPLLKAVPNKSGVSTWRVAAVTELKENAKVVLQDGAEGTIPAAELGWMRGKLRAGDIIYVEAMSGEGVAPGSYFVREVPNANGAIVAVDPFTGHVLALSGGFSYGSSQFDRAMQAMRQPGSTFKPFVYATALDKGYTPVTKILDAPFSAPQGPGLPWWQPENYEAGEYLGPTTLRRGVELSRNLMTARLAHTIGMTSIADTVERMGVYNKLPRYLANSLGSEVTTLLKMTTGYAEFVNGGRKLEATLIDRVQDRHGKTVYRFDKRVCSDCNQLDWHEGQEEPLLAENQEQVLDPRTAYQMVSILEGVIQRGTGQTIKVLNRPLAGKTGTSSDFRDAWFIGFSPDLALGVWVGKDNFQTLGNGEQGALAAAPIFREFMREALADVPPAPFRIPQGVIMVPVSPYNGAVMSEGAPGSILEAFKPGTEPGQAYAVSEIDDRGVVEGGATTVSAYPGDLGLGANAGLGVGAASVSGAQAATPAASLGPPPPPATISTGTGGLY